MQKTLVVVPTFNERENIGTLIDGLFLQPAPVDVLVVDDASPDGTAEVVRERQAHYGSERLQLTVRKEGKAGRGSACLHGFALARERGYGAAIEMDADLSHDPKDIPRLIEKLSEADVVIGSKYVPGGKVVGWEWYRKYLSRGANFYAKLILQMPIRDFTNGYRCYGPKALAILPSLEIEGKGFTVIPQMSYQLWKRGMRFAEIPIVFTNRRRGVSNMSFREMRESFLAILRIRSHTLHLHTLQLFKFGVTGVTNTFVDIGLLVLFVEVVHLPLLFANPVADILAISNAFLMNKLWTFRNGETQYVSQYGKFIAVYGTSLLLSNGMMWLFVGRMGIWYIPAKLMAVPLCAVWNYLWMHFQVFSAHKTTQKQE